MANKHFENRCEAIKSSLIDIAYFMEADIPMEMILPLARKMDVDAIELQTEINRAAEAEIIAQRSA